MAFTALTMRLVPRREAPRDEILRILQIGDTACSLDFHVRATCFGKEGHVLPGGAAPPKPVEVLM